MSEKGSMGGDRTIIYLHTNDERRHKSKCRYYSDGYCKKRLEKCIGSSHCEYYEERPNIDEETKKDFELPEKEQDNLLPGRPLDPFDTLSGKKIILFFKESKKQYGGTIIGSDANHVRIRLDHGGIYDYDRHENKDYCIRALPSPKKI